MPIETDINPATRKNFLPGASLSAGFRFASDSGAAFNVFVGLNVFWDIPWFFSLAKVKNLIRFHSIPLQNWFFVGLFFLAPFFSEAQIVGIPSSFELVFQTNDQNSISRKVNCTSANEVWSLLQLEIKAYHENGFPFASLKVDTIAYLPNAQFFISLERGPEMRNGDLLVHGDSTVKSSTLRKWIRFKKDLPFSSKTMKAIPFLSSRIPFASEFSPPVLEWFGNQAMVHLYVRKSKNNSFSGILGILPQPQQNKPIVTGNLDGNLVNLFGRGISLDFKWTRFAPSSQTAGLTFRLPVLDYSGLGLESNFDLFRQDSIINRRKADAQILSTTSSLWQFRLGISSSFSSGRYSEEVFKYNSVSINSLLIGLRFDPQLPNQIQLKRKFFILQALPSVKKIGTKDGKMSVNHMDLQTSGSFPFLGRKRFALLGRWNSGMIFSKEVTLPDQFRVGGSKSLRGFNENYFFASQYVLCSLQPQFLVDQSLMVGCFSDFFVFSGTKKMGFFPESESAFGFGVFAELEIGSNLIQISLANGFSKSFPFNFQTTKIHFGYVARF
jgi:hypothetical protein